MHPDIFFQCPLRIYLDHLVFLIKELDISRLSQEEYTKTVDEILLFLMLKEDKNE